VTKVAALTVPAATWNVADFAPCGTVTLAGTLAAAASELESDTTEPPPGAPVVSLTVALPVCPLANEAGLTATLLSSPAGRLMVKPNVSLMPEYDAVKVTGVLFVTVPPLTSNVVEAAPSGIATLAGTVALAEDERRAIATPALGAADVKATLQVVVDGGVIDTESHQNPFILSGKIVTVPPVVEIGSDEPVGSAASLRASCSDDDVSVAELDNASNTEATTPLPIGVALGPDSTQVRERAVLLQDTDLFAAAAAGPVVMVAEVKSTVEYLSVQSSEAAASPIGSVRPRFRATVEPGLA
jgi:hypothetical protein